MAWPCGTVPPHGLSRLRYDLMNIILGINTTIALLTLFAVALCLVGWACIRALKFVARLLRPLSEDDQPAAQRQRPAPAPKSAQQPQTKKAA
jgi:hypothetical protein